MNPNLAFDSLCSSINSLKHEVRPMILTHDHSVILFKIFREKYFLFIFIRIIGIIYIKIS